MILKQSNQLSSWYSSWEDQNFNKTQWTWSKNQWKAESSMKTRPPHQGHDHKIKFWDSETSNLDKPHDNALVIRIDVAEFELSRVMIDTGSSVDLIFYNTFKQMGFTVASALRASAIRAVSNKGNYPEPHALDRRSRNQCIQKFTTCHKPESWWVRSWRCKNGCIR